MTLVESGGANRIRVTGNDHVVRLCQGAGNDSFEVKEKLNQLCVGQIDF